MYESLEAKKQVMLARDRVEECRRGINLPHRLKPGPGLLALGASADRRNTPVVTDVDRVPS